VALPAAPEQYETTVLQGMVAEVWRFVYLAISPLLTRANADPLFTALLAALQHFTFAAGKYQLRATSPATYASILQGAGTTACQLSLAMLSWVAPAQCTKWYVDFLWMSAGTLGVKDARNQLLSCLCELTLLSQEDLAVVPRQGTSKQVRC
jgi:hypothetical protein